MTPREALTKGLEKMIEINPATLSFVSGSTTVTCSCYFSFTNSIRYDMEDSDYKRTHEDTSVICKTADIEDWGLEPKKSKVTVNGVSYMTGGIFTTNDTYSWLSLRTYNA
jgi:hypothetical protein